MKTVPEWIRMSMRGILVDDKAVEKWYDMQIPALNNRTPRQVIEDEEDWTPVCKLLESYYDPSYS